MKKMIKSIANVFFMFTLVNLLLLNLAQSQVKPLSKPTKITSTFIAESHFANTTSTFWNQELADMREIGIDHIIFNLSKWDSPTKLPILYAPGCAGTGTYQYQKGTDGTYPIMSIMKKAKELGMKVFIGTSNSGDVYQFYNNSTDRQKLYNHYENMIKEMRCHFSSNSSFAGVYVPHESFLNFYSDLSTATRNIDRDLTKVNVEAATRHLPSYPVMSSPIVYTHPFPFSWNFRPADLNILDDDIYHFVKDTGIDIIALQDKVGDHNINVIEIKKKYASLRIGIDRAKQLPGNAGLQFWANIEVFDLNGSRHINNGPLQLISADINKISKQIQAALPYVDKLTMWEFTTYMNKQVISYDPSQVSAKKLFYQYKERFISGYKNLALGLKKRNSLDELKKFGNGYFITSAPSSTYPDSNSELTDGIVRYWNTWINVGNGNPNDDQCIQVFSNQQASEWVGWNQNYTEIIVDLGAIKSINSVQLHHLLQTGPAIRFPQLVAFRTSNDMNIWTWRSEAKLASFSNNMTTYACGAEEWSYLPLSSMVSARYLKISISPQPASWSFISELEIFGR